LLISTHNDIYLLALGLVCSLRSRLYHYCNLVERLFKKLKHFRVIADRYEKRATNFLAGVKLASF
jgi:transposase